jgi:hypothetical protein
VQKNKKRKKKEIQGRMSTRIDEQLMSRSYQIDITQGH